MQKRNNIVIAWLLLGCTLIAVMVVIGGITRLTHSGLSMVDWRPIMGSIPPLSEQDWLETFNKYKTSPEFKIVNSDFAISDFKAIFWWEFIHRELGRFIGIVFIVPFVFFLVKKWFTPKLVKQTILILVLGGLQGILGWIMVKSGLNKDPNVSHYKLAAHLITALTAFGYTFWVALSLIYQNKELSKNRSYSKWSIYLLIIAVVQIVYGGFVAGLKAGLHYNTFPKMNGHWIHPSITMGFEKLGLISMVENIATVQFIHRSLGLSLLVLVFIFFVKNFNTNKNLIQVTGVTWLHLFTLIQVTLGVLTLLFHVPVLLGVLHQFGALILITVLIHNIYISSNAKS